MTASPGWIRPQGVTAWHVVPGRLPTVRESSRATTLSPFAASPIHRATDVTRMLWRAGPGRKSATRSGATASRFEVPLVTAPQENPSSIENYLRVTALLYLFIGLFIFVRRWNAPRAIHFYVFCLVSFILYSFHYSGKAEFVRLDRSTGATWWRCCCSRRCWCTSRWCFRSAAEPVAEACWRFTACRRLCWLLHVFVATATLDFLPSISSRDFLDQIELVYLGVYFLLAAANFPGELSARAERRAAAAIEVGHRRNVRGNPSVFRCSTCCRG